MFVGLCVVVKSCCRHELQATAARSKSCRRKVAEGVDEVLESRGVGVEEMQVQRDRLAWPNYAFAPERIAQHEGSRCVGKATGAIGTLRLKELPVEANVVVQTASLAAAVFAAMGAEQDLAESSTEGIRHASGCEHYGVERLKRETEGLDLKGLHELSGRAGLPTTTEPGGTSLTTTAPPPTVLPSPTLARMTAAATIQH